jgi:hypothetical protein
MTPERKLSAEQLELLSALTLAYPAGFIYGEDKTEARALADGLVKSRHLVPVEVDDGRYGYQLSPELVNAHRAVTALQSEQASLN